VLIKLTIETISHEGILPDQGDTVEFFAQAALLAIAKNYWLFKQRSPRTEIQTIQTNVRGIEAFSVFLVQKD
jgi:hypothetical protein